MAIYFPNQNIQEIGGGINITGSTVVQIQETRTTNTLAFYNWSTANFLMSGTITPKSASNKILVYVYIPFRFEANDGAWALGNFAVFRPNTSGSQLMNSGWEGGWRHIIHNWQKYYLDSPNSTSTQTYSVYCYNYPSGSGTMYVNNYGGQQASDGYAYIRLTEISV